MLDLVSLILGYILMVVGGTALCLLLGYYLVDLSYRRWITVQKYWEFRIWYREKYGKEDP